MPRGLLKQSSVRCVAKIALLHETGRDARRRPSIASQSRAGRYNHSTGIPTLPTRWCDVLRLDCKRLGTSCLAAAKIAALAFCVTAAANAGAAPVPDTNT